MSKGRNDAQRKSFSVIETSLGRKAFPMPPRGFEKSCHCQAVIATASRHRVSNDRLKRVCVTPVAGRACTGSSEANDKRWPRDRDFFCIPCQKGFEVQWILQYCSMVRQRRYNVHELQMYQSKPLRIEKCAGGALGYIKSMLRDAS